MMYFSNDPFKALVKDLSESILNISDPERRYIHIKSIEYDLKKLITWVEEEKSMSASIALDKILEDRTNEARRKAMGE